jgi:hypothetical protein
MKLKKMSFIAMLILFAIPGIYAQNKPDSISTELPNEKGDLYQLTQRTFLAFNAYVCGSSKLDEGQGRQGISINKKDHGTLYESFQLQTRPRIAIFKNGKKESEGISNEDLKKITIDDVKSIEVIYGTTENVLYGTSGITCVIKITLKR